MSKSSTTTTVSQYRVVVGHDKEEIVAARTRTFIYWINVSLKIKSLRIKNLDSDLENGVILIKLMECLAPKKKTPGR